MARGEGRRLTYPSIPRDPTGVHARFRALNFERSLPVSPAVIKRNSRGGVATDFAPAVDARRRQPRRREGWAAAQFVWFKVWCFCVSTGSLCSLWPETGVGPSKSLMMTPLRPRQTPHQSALPAPTVQPLLRPSAGSGLCLPCAPPLRAAGCAATSPHSLLVGVDGAGLVAGHASD